ncbi:GpE family phage tail protein [Vibrio chagasii]|uniref:GpE family phage tail protein n=1 Tax=Vibrio chagasii TaxID=170679 RepID=UPI0038CD9CCA
MGTIAYGGRLFFRSNGVVIAHVEEHYADIALVFHWPPREIDRLSYDDLLLFRELARQRHEQAPQESE